MQLRRERREIEQVGLGTSCTPPKSSGREEIVGLALGPHGEPEFDCSDDQAAEGSGRNFGSGDCRQRMERSRPTLSEQRRRLKVVRSVFVDAVFDVQCCKNNRRPVVVRRKVSDCQKFQRRSYIVRHSPGDDV